MSRREAMQGTGVALGSLVASGSLTERVMAQSDGPTNEISGTVEDDSGAVEGATVVAVPHDTSLAALATTTASDGTYIFEQSDLHDGENLYHVINRDGSEAAPRRGEQNYPFIAAEGAATIPESGLSHRHEVPELTGFNDGDTVSTFSATTGMDAAGSGTYRTNVQNGLPVIRSDGSSDGYEASISAVSSPFTAYFVIVDAAQVASTERIFDDRQNGDISAFWAAGENWGLFTGAQDGQINGQSTATPVILGFEVSSSAYVRENGTETATGDLGSRTLDNLSFMKRQDDDSNVLGGDWGESIFWNRSLTLSEREQVESVLSDRWSITV